MSGCIPGKLQVEVYMYVKNAALLLSANTI